MMIRGIVTSVVEGMVKRFAAMGLIEVADREYFQHYGFTSRPKEGAEIVYLVEGNVVIALGSDDRRYRLKVKDGEAALYDDLNQVVHLTRDGIRIESGKRIQFVTPEVDLTPVGHLHGFIKTDSHVKVGTGATGCFAAFCGKVVTVANGIIISID